MTVQHFSSEIKKQALSIGFDACGIARADYLDEDEVFLKNWLTDNCHADMSYMANYFDKRLDPRLLVDNAKSVVVVLLNYFPAEQQNSQLPQIAKYAYGADYHTIIKNKLHELLHEIRRLSPEVEGRAFVDTAPVLERRWAQRAGLGWIGKNTNLINPQLGSFVFIGELILNIELSPDLPLPNRCGTCHICLDNCPTRALHAPYKLDARRCLSYHSIESKNAIPLEISTYLENKLYGCDNCQDCCPWNRPAAITRTVELAPLPEILSMKREDWLQLSEEEFAERFRFSPIKRAGLAKIKKTLSA
ncbi:MAG: tRNA epoxyqueuosine(34) reductase QueG [Prevotellaceae bacterium]|jgi:epoxyqueuosine reductase|nr:tRNA epoxyqueuosine(34) reductase QueG [Prevotellaceae bacterium]